MTKIKLAFTFPWVVLTFSLLFLLGSVIYINVPKDVSIHVQVKGKTNAFTDSCELRSSSVAGMASVFQVNRRESNGLLATEPVVWKETERPTPNSCFGTVSFTLQPGTDYVFHLDGYPTGQHITKNEVRSGSVWVTVPVEIWRQVALTVNLGDVATEGCTILGIDWQCSGLKNLQFDEITGDCSAGYGSKYATLLLTESPFIIQGLSTDASRVPYGFEGEFQIVDEDPDETVRPGVVCSLTTEFDLYDDPEGYQITTKWGTLRYTHAEMESSGWNVRIGVGDYQIFRE